MNEHRSDALVFFGVSGDLAYKKIFPSLQTMIKRGNLDMPIIGVAQGGLEPGPDEGTCEGQPREARRT
jgi:glucose-6-phosphate 1-dehydrogenase